MTEEERNLMIAIAKSLGEQGEAIKKLMVDEKTLTPKIPQVLDLRALGIRPIKQTIEQFNDDKRFKMDVQFNGAQSLPYEERMQKAEQFLAELEEIFHEYGVSKLSGTYVKESL